MLEDPGVLAMLTAAVLLGALSQRATGMGFSLVAAPFLVIALGPFQGVLVANACGIASSMLNLTQVYRDVDWKRARWVTPAALVGIVPGAVAVYLLSTPVLAITISVLVLLGLAATIGLRKLELPNSPVVSSAGGLASGFMSVTAAVGGPGLVIYALATKWPHRQFAATAQVHFTVVGAASLIAKGALPSVSPLGWALIAAALGLGLLLGNLLTRRINGLQALRIVIVISVLGATLSLVQGIQGL